jgi:2-keto-myo-inositol isomerase
LLGLNGATTGAAGLQTDLAAAAAAGYAAIELRDTKLEAYLGAGGSLAGIRAQCLDSRLAVASLNALEDSTLAAGAARQAVFARWRQLCAWAAGLACPVVVAVPSFLSGQDPHTVREQTADALRRMAAAAHESGVRLGFEFLGFPTCSVRTLEAALDVIDTAGDPAIGVVIDAFHFFAGGSTWQMLEELDPARLLLVHLDDAENLPFDRLTDAHRLLPGDGIFPLREFVRRLQALGYAGVFSLELFRPEYWTWDPFELAGIGRRKMEALFVHQ